jgi:hypothetical protein
MAGSVVRRRRKDSLWLVAGGLLIGLVGLLVGLLGQTGEQIARMRVGAEVRADGSARSMGTSPGQKTGRARKLTIRGITRDVALDVEFLGLDETGLQGEQRIGFSATTTIRRSDYGVGAAAGEGQKIVVGDKITIQLDLQAALGS